jgi:hypothetical protein
MPGWYRFDIPDAALATAKGPEVCFHFQGVTNMAPTPVKILLVGWDNQDGVRGGLTALPNAAAAASGGLVINGTNSGTVTLAALTVTGATTCTGNVSMAAGLNITQSASNTSALVITGNGTGHGIATTSGSGATGNGITATSAATNGHGVSYAGVGTGDGLRATGGATGRGIHAIGGATSGAGLRTEGTAGNANATEYVGQGSAAGLSVAGGATGVGVTIAGGGTSGVGIFVGTTSGDGFQILANAGHGLNVAAGGASKHGLFVTGGSSGVSDGLKAVAGTGGVDVRGNITGNLTGTVSTVTTVTNLSIKKNTALSNFEFMMTDSTNHNPATGKTVTCTRSIDGAAFAAGTLANVTEVAFGMYRVDFLAADLNGNTITLRATASASDDTFVTIVTNP